MRKNGLILAAALALPAAVNAATYNYDFSNATAGTVPTANQSPQPAGISYQGTSTIGAVGNDNWIWTSSTANVNSSIVRNGGQVGVNGNWASAYTTGQPATGTGAPTSYDSINTRVNNAGFSYSIPAASTFTVGFTAVLPTTPYGGNANTAYARSEVALGYDQTGTNGIRGTAATTENAETSFFFGYDSSAAVTGNPNGSWLIRGAGFGTNNFFSAQVSGVYRVQLVVDPTQQAAATVQTVSGINDGVGTLQVEQLFDGSGNAIASPSFVTIASGINLQLGRMTLTANGGTATGYDPSKWNGLFTRLSNNGGIDDISITTTPEPASLALLGLGGLAAIRRRRA